MVSRTQPATTSARRPPGCGGTCGPPKPRLDAGEVIRAAVNSNTLADARSIAGVLHRRLSLIVLRTPNRFETYGSGLSVLKVLIERIGPGEVMHFEL